MTPISQTYTFYSQTSIIRGSWAYQILAEKSAYNRGQRIIEVSYISLEYRTGIASHSNQ